VQEELSESKAVPDVTDLCLHDLFDQCVSRSPDEPAVVEVNRTLSYAELQRRAESLALTLRLAGVGPEVPVALFSERCIEAVIGILGILKAGGAYVPINPRDPDERLNRIIENAGIRLVLLQKHLRGRLQVPAAQAIGIDPDSLAYSSRSSKVVVSGVNPDNLAVIVYTSGSTGFPKGVEIPHRAITARLRNGYRARRHDVQKAPLSVVAHFSDLLVPLLSGGPIIFAEDACLTSGHSLLDLVSRNEPTRMVFVPSQLAVLLEAGSDALAALARLDSVILSGEPVTPALVGTFKHLLPHVTLLNAYGASEIAGLACMGEVSSPSDITVGSELPGCSVYLLDEELSPVADGTVGEVYFGGPQLARGYAGDPLLTAERFISDPFKAGGSRMYRTGDSAERHRDGRIKVLGRRDLEVKIHGFRVNLNEIETVLEASPTVKRAIVSCHSTGSSERLIAFVLPERSSNDPPLTSSLRSAIAVKLPGYMVPSRIVLVTSFPLLPNGKVDRGALDRLSPPALSESQTPVYVPPSTDTERTLAHIWEDLLRLPSVGATDDFFGLGGDSLDATRLILRAEDVGLSITLAQIEDAPSLAALARLIDENRTDMTPPRGVA
jgi:amino acid adenylation domain-containing protein